VHTETKRFGPCRDINCKLSLSLSQRSLEEQEELLQRSATLYVGNLSFFTKEEQIYELFMMCGDVKRVIMGLDRHNHTPCGFCFVE